MKFNNIKSKVISALLATTFLVTSNISVIPIQAAQTTPSIEHGTAFNPEWEIQDLSVDDVAPALVPRVQMLRVSLIKTIDENISDMRVGGMPATKEDIPELVQNPIHMVPDNYKAIWGSEITPDNIRSPKNIDPTRSSKGLNCFNSRREYLANDSGPSGTVLAYGAGWSVDFNDNGQILNQQWVFNDSKFNTQQIKRVFPDKCVGNTISDIGGNANAFYKDNPPAGTNINSSMSSAEYFDNISSAVFIDTEYGQDTLKQVFIYHIIADMLSRPDDPYCEEVEKIVQNEILTKKYKILIEPTITFDVSRSKVLKAMFSDIKYITLTAGDCATENAVSTVYHGASSPLASVPDHNGQSTRYRNFNPITHGKGISEIMYKFYESIMLKNTDKAVNLHAVDDKNYYNNLYNEFTNYSISTGQAYDGRVAGPLLSGQKGASVTTPFYESVAKNITNAGGNPATTTCKVDMMSALHTGAMYILPISYDKIDIKADVLVPFNNNLKKDSQPIGELNYNPIYDRDSIYVDQDGLNCIDIKAISSINFDNNDGMQATQWSNKVSLNNQTNLTKDNDYIKQLDDEALQGTVFIPAITKNLIYFEFADSNGNGLGTIQFPTNTGLDEKLRLENAHMYGFSKDSTGKLVGKPTYMTVSNHGKGNEDKRDDNGELAVGHELPAVNFNGTSYNIFEDKKINNESYMKLGLPLGDGIPSNATYLKVIFQINRGQFEDSDTYMRTNISRPQGKESTGSADMPCKLSDTNGGEDEYFGEVERNFDNNTKIIYIKLDNSLDLSADSISKNSNPIITKNPTKINQCNLVTNSTANEGAIKSYPESEVTQILYYYFSDTNSNEFKNLYDTAVDNIDWSNPDTLTELVSKYNDGLSSLNGRKITQRTHIKPTSGIDPMDINWEECAISPELEPSQTVYLHLALVVNPDNSIPNEDTYENNVTFESYPYDVPDDDEPLPPSSALSCYVPIGSAKLPLKILNNSTPINYITGILNNKVLEANNDPAKVAGSLNSHYGARIRVQDVPNSYPTGYRPNPTYTEHASIVVSRCNGENEDEEPDDSPEWVFFDDNPDNLIFHEIAFKYLSYDTAKKKYYVATQILPYTKRVIEHTPCDCEDGCSSPTVTYHYYRLDDTQEVDYTLIFDDLYTQDGEVSSPYSLESLLNQEPLNKGGEYGKYHYIATAGSLIGLTMRTRLISDFPSFIDDYSKDTGAGVPLDKGIVQLADSRGVFNSNNNIKAELELTDFEYVPHVSQDFSNTTGGSNRASAVGKSNDYYYSILTNYTGYTPNYTGQNPLTLDTSPRLKRDEDALYNFNLDGSKPNGSWQYISVGQDNWTQQYINVRYYRYDIKPNTSTWNGTQYSTRGQRGVITDHDYSDAIKVNKNGEGQINNKDTMAKRLYKNGKSVADAIDRYSYKYCSLRLKPIIYTQQLYLPDGLHNYNYTNYDGATLENSSQSVLGLCSDYNIAILGTTYNQYTLN